MALKSSVLVSSQKRNRYFFDKNQKKLTLCHPLFFKLIEMIQNEEHVAEWISGLGSEAVEIEGIGAVFPEEIRYYHKKYLLFKENGCFSGRDMGSRMCADLKNEDIDALLANVSHIVFEVTDRCNLKCEYCAYGKFYGNYGPRQNRNMDPEMAKQVLDYLLAKIRTARNDSHQHHLLVGFYGGEPLLNFPLINEIVDYLGRSDLSGIVVNFNMTTNGLLLEKHMDFLAMHKFNLMISLDGDEKSNCYRVFPNGAPAFSDIFRNIKLLRTSHPEYFRENVNFNAVLHGRNSLSDVVSFFEKKFDCFPNFGPLSAMGIREEKKEEFWKIYKTVLQDLKNCSDSQMLGRRFNFKLPDMKELLYFLRHQNGFVFINFNHLLVDENKTEEFSIGTCLPFQKKIFITVDGRIFPCERIGQFQELGRVEADGVHLDAGGITRIYNDWLNELKQQCTSCYKVDACPMCIYYINGFPKSKACQSHTKESEFREIVSKYVDIIEKKPQIYKQMMNEG